MLCIEALADVAGANQIVLCGETTKTSDDPLATDHQEDRLYSVVIFRSCLWLIHDTEGGFVSGWTPCECKIEFVSLVI